MSFVQRFLKEQNSPGLATIRELHEETNRKWLGHACFRHALLHFERAYPADVLVKVVNKKGRLAGLVKQHKAPFRAQERIADLCFVAASLDENHHTKKELLREAMVGYINLRGNRERQDACRIGIAKIDIAEADTINDPETKRNLYYEAKILFEAAGMKNEAQDCAGLVKLYTD